MDFRSAVLPADEGEGAGLRPRWVWGEFVMLSSSPVQSAWGWLVLTGVGVLGFAYLALMALEVTHLGGLGALRDALLRKRKLRYARLATLGYSTPTEAEIETLPPEELERKVEYQEGAPPAPSNGEAPG